MKNIPKIIPVMYAKALKDGTLVWGEDCVSATNDFEEDGFTGVALVRLSDVDACQTNEQGRAAEGAVSPCQHDHVPKVRCFACPETDDRKHCERDCLVVQRGTPDETEYLCQAWVASQILPAAIANGEGRQS